MGLVERDYFEISGAVASVKIGAGSSGSSSHNFAINTNNPYILVMTDVEVATDNQPLNFYHLLLNLQHVHMPMNLLSG